MTAVESVFFDALFKLLPDLDLIKNLMDILPCEGDQKPSFAQSFAQAATLSVSSSNCHWSTTPAQSSCIASSWPSLRASARASRSVR